MLHMFTIITLSVHHTYKNTNNIKIKQLHDTLQCSSWLMKSDVHNITIRYFFYSNGA